MSSAAADLLFSVKYACNVKAVCDIVPVWNLKSKTVRRTAIIFPMDTLVVEHLKTRFETGGGVIPAVDGVSLRIPEHGALGLVGESGCGKSVTALSIMRLLPMPPARITDGRILLEGENLLELPEREMRRIRGNRVSMIFQEPMTSLNPVMNVGEQVAEVFRNHRRAGRREARDMAAAMIEKVRISDPRRLCRQYPHQLSGGIRQRVMIAMALACRPRLLVADEPTTALDVTVQAQVLQILDDLRRDVVSSLLIITHNFGVIADTAREVVVMYAGQVVETAPVKDLFESPLHPYTRGLLKAVPRAGSRRAGRRLSAIEGSVPDPGAWPPGCRFHPRCPMAMPECRKAVPPLDRAGDAGRYVRCIRWNH